MKKHLKINLIFGLIIGALIVLGVLYFIADHDSLNIPTFIFYLYFVLLGAGITALVLTIIYYKQTKRLQYLENRVGLWNSISYRVKGAGEGAFNNMPVGIILFKDDGTIEWANNFAKEVFQSKLVEMNLKNLDESMFLNVMKKRQTFSSQIYGHTYECSILPDTNILYLKDITERIEYLTRYKDRTPALGVINIDNLSYDLSGLDVKERTEYENGLVRIISSFEEEYNICISSISTERYIMILDHKTLTQIIHDNFKIVNSIREYFSENSLHITASIGVACEDTTPDVLLEKAKNQLKLALDRGGDQTVVYINGEVSYIGARTINLEERTAVSVRVKTETLLSLIKNSSRVVVMAHSMMDADAFGSSLALQKLAKACGKESFVVFNKDKVDSTVNAIYDSMLKDHNNSLESLITEHDAFKMLDNDTLLIISDCQFEQILFDDKLYKAAKHVALIDHHRRNATSINQYDYVYVDQAASSSVELVVEMYGYLPQEIFDNLDISEAEATWMLMGVQVDTNNFAYRTSSTTFQILARLQKFGANSAMANRYLRADFEFFMSKMQIINGMEIYKNEYAIAACPEEEIVSRAFIAKIADDIVLVDGVKLAFCIGRISDDSVAISARSLDEGNAQVIMEHLGGGGHFNSAATQIQNMTIQEAKEKLKNMIDTLYQGENETMKLILVKDVRGKGKENDVLEFPAGYANYLLRSGQAIDASPDNLKKLQEKLNIKEAEAEKELQDAKALRDRINSLNITIKVKVGEQGKFYGSVTTKQMVEELELQHGIVVDKRKVMLDKDITGLGTYKIAIHLHKEVSATLTVYVVEKEK